MDTIDEIYNNIKKLYDVDSDMIDILAVSGRDSETKYTNEYLNMLDDMKDLQKALHAVLDNFNDAINDIEYALEPLPIKPTKKIPSMPAFDEMDTIAKLAGY